MDECTNRVVPLIKAGDIIRVYSAHESAWGSPSKSYLVERVDSDGSPVSAQDLRHSVGDVVSISRKDGGNYVCIWKKENYLVDPWGEAAIDLFVSQLSAKDRKALDKASAEISKSVNELVESDSFKKLATAYMAAAMIARAFALTKQLCADEKGRPVNDVG